MTRTRLSFLPVVERELRVASRRPGTHWGRSLAGFLAIALGVYGYAMSHRLPLAQLGQVLFLVFSWLAFLFCLLAGVRHTATCVTSERRDGTLGLLFLTSLKGYDVVLGKLVASSASALQALLAILPVIALPLLMGGVEAEEFARVLGVLLATLLFSLALGLFMSLWGENDRRAVLLTMLALLILTLGPWMLLAWWAGVNQAPRDLTVLLVSPAYAQILATSGLVPGLPSEPYGLAVGLLVLEGLGLLVLSSILLPRLYGDRPLSPRSAGWGGFWRVLKEGSVASRLAFRARLLDINPFFWLAARTRREPLWTWAFVVGNVLTWFGLLAVWPDLWDQLDTGRYLLLSLLLHGLLRIWIALAATRRLAEDRRTGTLELLLSTPLSVAQVLAGQLQALRRQFRGPLIAVLVLDLVFCWATVRESVTDQEMAWMVYGARGAMLLGDAHALAWYGMWRALTTRSATEAAAVNLFWILVLPWIVLLTLGSLVGFAQVSQRWDWEVTDRMILAAWVVVGWATDVVCGVLAYARLSTRFRVEAAERRPSGWLARLFESSGGGSR